MLRPSTLLAVVATGALVGAGSTVAADRLLIRGSNVVDGSLTGRDLKDGSVAQKDLTSALRARLNRIGIAGASGPQGPQGPQGPVGPSGPAGLTSATLTTLAAPLTGVTAATKEVLSVDVPVGGHTAAATAQITNTGPGTTVTCELAVGGNTGKAKATLPTNGTVTLATVSANQLTAPGTVRLSCGPAAGGTVTIDNASLVVTRVTTVTSGTY